MIAELVDLGLRGSAATRSEDYATVGAVCRDGMALVATAKAGPPAPDIELQRHYARMTRSYEAGFSTCSEGTSESVDRSLASLERGNKELRASTARLIVLLANDT